MKIYTISIVAEIDTIKHERSGTLKSLTLGDEAEIVVYQDETNGEIFIPFEADLSYRAMKNLFSKVP